ncbi:MAG: D-glycerate dehydrogenase [Alphaproteobacteria bacterium]|jgi:lactate dehydrogenase-like 2-hydroxyacid dehydrogenase|nr:D-glycerate dehydrogenase [Alphaproteobacteria bacterium]
MTKRPVVVATRHFPEAVEQRLQSMFDARLNPEDRALSHDELVARAQGADGLMVAATGKVDADLIHRLPASIRIIATFSVGYEHIDIAAAEQRGILVTNTPDVLTDATAEIALLLLLAAARRAHEGAAMLRQDQWTGWTPTQLMGIGLTGKRLGIVGMGRIGQALAERARANGMEIHYYNRTRLSPEQEKGAIHYATVEALLPQAQFLSLHCPLTPQTVKLMDARRLALLPEGAVLINTARGGIVDDEALIAALKSRRLAAAGLDVFDGEPKVDKRYFAIENAFILPHMGSATIETRNAMGFRAIENLQAVLIDGKAPPHRVKA